MGRYCLTQGKLATAKIGEELSIKQFPHTFAVVNGKGVPVCIPHEGCTLEMLTVDPNLAEHPVLSGLRPGQSVHYEIQGSGQQERDVVTLPTGKIVNLHELKASTFQITGERPS